MHLQRYAPYLCCARVTVYNIACVVVHVYVCNQKFGKTVENVSRYRPKDEKFEKVVKKTSKNGRPSPIVKQYLLQLCAVAVV